MSLSLSGYRISLIYTPTDMRCGFTRLSSLAKQCAQIDVSLCRIAWSLSPRPGLSPKSFGPMQKVVFF